MVWYSSVSTLSLILTVKTGLKIQIRAIKSIASGDEITASLINLAQNKTGRHKQLSIKTLHSVCECDKCRLNLDKDMDYEEHEKRFNKHLHHSSFIGRPSIATVYNRKYAIDWRLIKDLRDIYGEYHPMTTECLLQSFICFALHSKYSSKSSIKLLYEKIEPSLRITHGTDHQAYILLQHIYNTSII